MWFNDGTHGWMMAMGMPFAILFWIFFLLAGVALWKGLRRGNSSSETKSKTARELLDERYACGEISREEYEQKKADIAN